MTTDIAINPTIKKIDLAEKAEACCAIKKAATKARSVKWVEETLLPRLILLAENGNRFYQGALPADVDAEEVIKALHERAICTASRAGHRGEISIIW